MNSELNFLQFIVLAITFAGVTSKTLRGHNESQQEKLQDTIELANYHRRLMKHTSCRLILLDIEYGPTDDEPYGYSKEEWVCELPDEESSRLGMKYIEIDRSCSVVGNATSGMSTLTTSKAIIDTQTQKMFIPSDASIEVRSDVALMTKNRRDLADKMGTLNTLVIRVIDSQGIAPDASISQLENDIFEDKSCLKSQYEGCSYGKLKIEPFSGKTETDVAIKNGIVDVEIDFDLSTNNNRGSLQQAAFDAARDQLGNLDSDTYGLVMFCMPPGTGNWLAYAYTNKKYSFYNNEWCSFVSAQMHEVGHNLGLAHSGQEGKGKYGDRTGLMGASFSRDDQFMCFNAAKSYQLGWYDSQIKTVYPLDERRNPVRQFTLNGVADFEENEDALVVLRLEQPSLGQDYFIGYNHAKGINKDTAGDQNMVTIIRKEGNPTEYAQSTKVASLNAGESFLIENFDGERDVEIRFVGLRNVDTNDPTVFRDATIEVVDIENAPTGPDEDPCEAFTIEFNTDGYPSDNAFSIIEDNSIGRVIAKGPEMTEQYQKYTVEACLPYNAKYKFILSDTYKDGICCGQGKGSYRGIDAQGNVLFDSKDVQEDFALKIETFSIGNNPNPVEPTPPPTKPPTSAPTIPVTAPPTKPPAVSPTLSPTKTPTSAPTISVTSSPTKPPTVSPTLSPTKPPTSPPTQSPSGGADASPTSSPSLSPVSNSPTIREDLACKDKGGKFNWKGKKRGRKRRRSCSWIAKKKKCNKVFNNEQIWKSCPKSCNRCEENNA